MYHSEQVSPSAFGRPVPARVTPTKLSARNPPQINFIGAALSRAHSPRGTYWDVHLIGELLFTKIVIFDIRNSPKFNFG